MGRFISADTIVPNFANPQSLNRYSYCLNNPLKYIDPSGHLADIYGIDTTEMDSWDENDWRMIAMSLDPKVVKLLVAWVGLEGTAGDVTKQIEDSTILVSIKWGNLDDSRVVFGETSPTNVENKQITTIDLVLYDNYIRSDLEGIKAVISVLAHESAHTLGYILFPSVGRFSSPYEENVAMRFQYMVDVQTGYHPIRPGWQFWEEFFGSKRTMYRGYRQVIDSLSVDLSIRPSYSQGEINDPWWDIMNTLREELGTNYFIIF
jgi:hypothetical protein